MKYTLKPIRTKKDYDKALKLVDKYLHAEQDTPESQLVEILSILIEKYEEEHFPIEAPDPAGAIKFRMEQLGLTRKNIADLLGGLNRVSEIFSGKRRLTIKRIKRPHKDLGVPAVLKNFVLKTASLQSCLYVYYMCNERGHHLNI